MNHKSVTLSAFVAAFLLSQGALAHTRFGVASGDENATYETTVNITHGCVNSTKPVIGTSVVFPDQVDSPIYERDGQGNETRVNLKASDIIKSGGYLRMIKSNDVFAQEDLKYTTINGTQTPIGLWAGGGEGVPPSNWVGKIPFRISAVVFQENSCAKSLTFVAGIVDVCEITPLAQVSEDNVNFWTPAVGSDYDGLPNGHAYNSPATFKVTRKSALPASCGAGKDYVIKPSAAQLNRDLPIKVNGRQIWPKP